MLQLTTTRIFINIAADFAEERVIRQEVKNNYQDADLQQVEALALSLANCHLPIAIC